MKSLIVKFLVLDTSEEVHVPVFERESVNPPCSGSEPLADLSSRVKEGTPETGGHLRVLSLHDRDFSACMVVVLVNTLHTPNSFISGIDTPSESSQ